MLPPDAVAGIEDVAIDDEVVEEVVEGVVAVLGALGVLDATDMVATGTDSCAAADVDWPQVWPELYVICTVANCRSWRQLESLVSCDDPIGLCNWTESHESCDTNKEIFDDIHSPHSRPEGFVSRRRLIIVSRGKNEKQLENSRSDHL